jgi:hypothetical protein
MKLMKSRREGFALAAAVLAMMVVGAIVTGGFYAVSQEHKIALSSDAGDLALYIAETGLSSRLGSTVASQYEAITLGDTAIQTIETVTHGGRTVGTYQTTITRIADLLFIVESKGVVTLGGPFQGAERTVAAVTRVRHVDFDTNGAIMVYGGLTVSGSAQVQGQDLAVLPSGAACTPKTSGTSAVVANPDPAVSITDQGGQQHIFGAVTEQPMDATDFHVFGDMTFDEVALLANLRYSSSGVSLSPAPVTQTVNGVTTCNTSVTTNWGDPLDPSGYCKTYFPIIEAQGDLTINGDESGQGILLVRGDLRVTGAFDFYGVIVVLGEVDLAGTSSGGGSKIAGTLIAWGGGNPLITNTALGNSDAQYSSCAIAEAVNGNSRLARAAPIKDRSWLDVSAIKNSY